MLAAQNKDQELKDRFTPLAQKLEENAATIDAELLDAQGVSIDIGGYYLPDTQKANEAMRPSKTFNVIIDAM